jgi:AraC-like DNA-binding protein
MRIGASTPALGAWPPVLATRTTGGRSAPHAHHAMHVVLAIDGPLRFRAGGAWIEARGVVTPPDVRHEIDARGREVLLVFVDPESRSGVVLEAAVGDRPRPLSAAEVDAMDHGVRADALMARGAERWLDDVVGALGEVSRPHARRVHPRIREALARIGASEQPPSLETLARAVGLSPSRFMHAFTESIGIPLRPYLAWLRLQRASGAIVRGVPLSLAAAQAGYADAAHMTRSFRAMLGMTPSMLRPARSAQRTAVSERAR